MLLHAPGTLRHAVRRHAGCGPIAPDQASFAQNRYSENLLLPAVGLERPGADRQWSSMAERPSDYRSKSWNSVCW